MNHAALTVAGTYIGTIIGAGFASGQEVMRFFTLFGPPGTVGVVAAAVLFAVFGAEILRLGHELRAASHRPVLAALGGRTLGGAMDAVVTAFLFGSTTTMVAAAGATMHEAWGLPHLAGSLALAAAATATVLLGLRGVVAAISRLSPAIVVAVLAIAAAALAAEPAAPTGLVRAGPVVPWWPLAAVLYVSFNLVGAVAVLAPLGAAVGRRSLSAGAVLGAAGLGLAALSIHLGIARHLGALHDAEVPMIRLATALWPWARDPYAIVMLAEIYTTAVASLFGLAARLREAWPGRTRAVAPAAGALSLLAAQAGFVTLVATLYPLVGAAGLLMLWFLARSILARGRLVPR